MGEFDVKQLKAPTVKSEDLPKEGDPYREWLDMATDHQPGPSARYMQQNAGAEGSKQKRYQSGDENELMLGYGKGAFRSDGDGDEENADEEKEKEQYKRK